MSGKVWSLMTQHELDLSFSEVSVMMSLWEYMSVCVCLCVSELVSAVRCSRSESMPNAFPLATVVRVTKEWR
jgi:hypothetical protein